MNFRLIAATLFIGLLSGSAPAQTVEMAGYRPQPGLMAVSEGGTLSLLFAEAHPERTQAVVLYGSWARRLAGPDYPFGPSAVDWRMWPATRW